MKQVIGPCTLYLGDCLEIAPNIKDVVSLVSDPPYGIEMCIHSPGRLAKTNKFQHVKIKGDDKPFDPIPWLKYPNVILWGGNHFADKLPSRARWLVWDKREGSGSNDFADCEIAWTSDKRPAKLFRYLWNGAIKKGERHESRVHPSQKPICLMEWCLSFVPKGLVLDPYMGGGSTGVACVRRGYPFVGIEIVPEYFDAACSRIEREVKKMKATLLGPIAFGSQNG